MRTVVSIIIGGIAAMTLTACGAAADVDPGTDRSPRTAHTPRFTTAEQHYLDMLASVDPQLDSGPHIRKLAVKVGHDTCDALDRGVTIEQIAEAASETMTGEDTKIAAATLLAATENLCPEYADERDAWLDGVAS